MPRSPRCRCRPRPAPRSCPGCGLPVTSSTPSSLELLVNRDWGTGAEPVRHSAPTGFPTLSDLTGSLSKVCGPASPRGERPSPDRLRGGEQRHPVPEFSPNRKQSKKLRNIWTPLSKITSCKCSYCHQGTEVFISLSSNYLNRNTELTAPAWDSADPDRSRGRRGERELAGAAVPMPDWPQRCPAAVTHRPLSLPVRDRGL